MAESLINGIQVPFVPLGGVDGIRQKPPLSLPEDRSFENVLKQELDQIKLSKHAQDRLNASQVQLSSQDMSRLQSAVSMAEQKGAKDSLVLLENMAFIVSVKNRTVVTAIDQSRLKENVFTNIDSAVIA